MQEVKLTVSFDDYENGIRMENLIRELAANPEAGTLESLVIGDWGQAYESSPDEFMNVLIELAPSFRSLKKLFIGDMGFEECEVSWIIQTDLTPLLKAFPELKSFTVKGSSGLSLEPLQHAKLEELVIICGGLSQEVLASITNAQLPELRKLELYLGVNDYGFDGSLEDVLPLLEQGRFPKLVYLGLKDSEIQDDIAKAVAQAPIVDQLEVLDLSQGTLSDEGAEALLASDKIKKLKHLDLSYHYMTDEMLIRWKRSGLSVDVSDQQQSDEDDWRYPSLTE
ncbi:STM4015 family protein [Paenibacillus illinoisensis]|uniref:STM4015 family protein n=1 Tax=Paenibacillus illinoisensis TaxID=59845 RepID=UPI001C8D7008|nr:STM4015 family protein [Paenibacillus illinoisensis]MBY0220253.1 STM4015 family protein [Paenibacillus illinoisensis]